MWVHAWSRCGKGQEGKCVLAPRHGPEGVGTKTWPDLLCFSLSMPCSTAPLEDSCGRGHPDPADSASLGFLSPGTQEGTGFVVKYQNSCEDTNEMCSQHLGGPLVQVASPLLVKWNITLFLWSQLNHLLPSCWGEPGSFLIGSSNVRRIPLFFGEWTILRHNWRAIKYTH